MIQNLPMYTLLCLAAAADSHIVYSLDCYLDKDIM